MKIDQQSGSTASIEFWQLAQSINVAIMANQNCQPVIFMAHFYRKRNLSQLQNRKTKEQKRTTKSISKVTASTFGTFSSYNQRNVTSVQQQQNKLKTCVAALVFVCCCTKCIWKRGFKVTDRPTWEPLFISGWVRQIPFLGLFFFCRNDTVVAFASCQFAFTRSGCRCRRLSHFF